MTTGNDPSRDPVFVVGMNGSGTTMLADSLGRHSDLYAFPFESKLIPRYAHRFGGDGRTVAASAIRRLADEIGRGKAFWHANGKQPLVLPPESPIEPTVAGIFEALLGHLAQREGKQRWVEKSPANTEYIALLADMFPTARFVHIIRDGRDAAQSFHRRWGFDPEHTIWRWKRTVAVGRQQGLALGAARYLELRYEDVTTDPARHMRTICGFIGVPFQDVVLGSSMRHMSAAHRAKQQAQIVTNSRRWQTYFAPETIQRLESLAGAQLAALGYDVDSNGDDELSSLRRRWLRGKDRFARTLSFFRDYGFRGLPMFLRVAQSAAVQAKSRRF